MNARLTIALVVVLALVTGIGLLIVTGGDSSPPDRVRVRRDFFYVVDDDAINSVAIQYFGETQKFVLDPNRTWRFTSFDGERVNINRWGGVTLLLSGPQFTRQLSADAPDLGRYGLENPATVITVGLEGIGEVEIRLGDTTPDGGKHYAQFEDDPGIYLIDSSWGDVISRLVTEPPHIPTPTPEPEPTAEAEATPEEGAKEGS